LVTVMARVKCKKCSAVYEQGLSGAIFSPHVGPYHYIKCPACKKYGWVNVYSSVQDSVTWPPQTPLEQPVEAELTEEEQLKKRIEDSKYEKP